MTIQHMSPASGFFKWAAAPAHEAPSPRGRGVLRRPGQTDWPAGAMLGIQIGVLIGIITLWQVGANLGVIDPFFWSKPSAIFNTLTIFFTTGEAWTDIGFTFRSTIMGFVIGTTA